MKPAHKFCEKKGCLRAPHPDEPRAHAYLLDVNPGLDMRGESRAAFERESERYEASKPIGWERKP